VRIARLLAAVLAALVLALAGCGGDDDGDEEAGQTGTTTAQTDTETGQTGTGAEESAGAAVWASTGCGVCHTLEAAGSTGTTGPNLDEVKPSQEEVAEQVREGGGGMPSFEDRLSAEEIQAVAQYVAESAGG
jgi:mono/diheme cytochrome c family protein